MFFSLLFMPTSALAATSTANGWVAAKSSSVPSWPHQTFVTEPNLKPPVLNVTGSSSSADSIFFSPQGGTQPSAMIVSSDGELIWMSEEGDHPNLTPMQMNGKPSFAYWNGTSLGNIEAYGSMLVFDNNYKQIHNVKLQDPDLGAEWYSYADAHEAFYTESGTMLLTAVNRSGPYDLREFGRPEHGFVFDCLVYEVDTETNEILFRWSAVDHLDKIPFSDSRALPQSAGNGTHEVPWDVYHLNSITTFGDGFIVGFRHTSTAYYINRAGEVVWQIHGTHEPLQCIQDFHMGDDTGFSWQHDIRVGHKTKTSLLLHLHDNVNWNPDSSNTSYGLALNVDLVNMAVSKEIRLSDEMDPVSTFAGGAMQSLGGGQNAHWWMDYGFIPKMKEFDSNGKCIFTLQFGEPLQDNTYRAYRSPWKGYPTTKPKVIARAKSGKRSTEVYVSWNGATEVKGWNVLVGQSHNNLSSIIKAEKSGFETMVEIPGTPKFVQVEPLGCGPWQKFERSEVMKVECEE